jgi:hypothetical protein
LPVFAISFALIFAANICVYFQYIFMHVVCANIYGANVLKPRFKIDVVIMIICRIVININSVLTGFIDDKPVGMIEMWNGI